VTKLEKEEREVAFSTTGEFAHRSIMVMAVAVILHPPKGPNPSFGAYNNQQTYYETCLRP
jgi:hypothetical protein